MLAETVLPSGSVLQMSASAKSALLHTRYIPPPIFRIRIASASQHDHWHRYRFDFISAWTKKLLTLATLRHGLLEKRNSATGGM